MINTIDLTTGEQFGLLTKVVCDLIIKKKKKKTQKAGWDLNPS